MRVNALRRNALW